MPRARSIVPPASTGSSAAKGSSAPKGRNIPAQGIALGSRHPKNPSPEPERSGDRLPGYPGSPEGVTNGNQRAAQGWRIVRLEDVAESIQYGHTASSTQEAVGPRFLRITDIQDRRVDWETVPYCSIPKNQIPKYRLAKGDLLFARTGATVGKSFLITTEIPESIFASYLIRVRVTDAVDPQFIAYYFQSAQYWQQISDSSAGIGQPNVNGSKLAKITFPLPPLPEQRRIVARIEELFSRLDAGVAALRHAKAQLQRYRQSVLAAAVTGQLTESDTASWSNETIADVCETVTDGDHQAPPKVPAGIPFLTIGNISSGGLDFSNTRFVPQSYFDEIKNHRIPIPNDVLYSVVGATIGIPVLVNTDRSFCFQRHIALLRPSKRILPKFLHLFMESPQTFRRAWAETTGSAQPTLPLKALRALPISLPPLAEQHQIVAEVETRTTAIDHLEAELDRQITRSNRLRQSILRSAFVGSLAEL